MYAFTDAAGKTKPGMVRVLDGEAGKDFYLELWDMPVENFGRFMLQARRRRRRLRRLPRLLPFFPFPMLTLPPAAALQIPAPLGIGTVELDDGSEVKGFICEAWVAEAARRNSDRVADITDLGSWLTFIEKQQQG